MKRRPTTCEGCGAPAAQLRATIGGYLCPACEAIVREDSRPERPPVRKDIPPEARMRNLPTPTGPTFLTTLFVDWSRRAHYG